MKVITIGREAVNNDIIINDSRVSKTHLQLVQDDNGNINAIDFGSTNGTFVNGHRIIEETALKKGDQIKIGDTVLHWESYFEEQEKFSQNQNNTTKSLRLFRMIIALLSVALLAAFACLFFANSNKKKDLNKIKAEMIYQSDSLLQKINILTQQYDTLKLEKKIVEYQAIGNNNELDAAIQKANKEITQKINELKNKENEIKQREQELNIYKKKIKDLESQNTNQAGTISNLKSDLDSKKLNMNSLSAEIEQLGKEKQELNKKLSEANMSNKEIKVDSENKLNDIKEKYEKQIGTLNEKIKSLNDENKKLKNTDDQIDIANKNLSELIKAVKAAGGDIKSTKKSAQNSKTNNIVEYNEYQISFKSNQLMKNTPQN